MKTTKHSAATAALKIALVPVLRDEQETALAVAVLAASTRFDWRTIAATATARGRFDVAAVALAMVAGSMNDAADALAATDAHSAAKIRTILAA